MAAPSGPARVLRIITRLNVGGPTRHVALLMDGLDPRHFAQLLVHGPAAPGEGEGLLSVPGPKAAVPALRRAPAPWRDLLARRALRRLIRDWRPDIVHTHQGKAGALGRLAARREGVPAIVHTYHGHTFEGYFAPALARAVQWMERRAAEASHALVCQAPSQEADVLRTLGRAAEGKTVVIPPAIPERFFTGPRDREGPRAALGASDATLVLLLPARLVPIKRPARALAVLAALRREIDAALWIAGDGPLRRELEHRTAALGLQGRVRFLGQRADIDALYAAADITLLVSAMEGTPLCLLESMAMGTPVAATAVGGVRELVDPAGLLLAPEASSDEWAHRILGALGSPASRAHRAATGRNLVSPRNRPELLLQAVTGLYTSLLHGR